MLFLRGLLQRVVANKHLINCQIDLYPNVFYHISAVLSMKAEQTFNSTWVIVWIGHQVECSFFVPLIKLTFITIMLFYQFSARFFSFCQPQGMVSAKLGSLALRCVLPNFSERFCNCQFLFFGLHWSLAADSSPNWPNLNHSCSGEAWRSSGSVFWWSSDFSNSFILLSSSHVFPGDHHLLLLLFLLFPQVLAAVLVSWWFYHAVNRIFYVLM